MDFAPKFGCSALIKLQPNQSTMAQTQISNSSNTLAVVLGTNQIVERCFAKMATDVTLQVRDKLIDIILAVLARECEDFDVESVRRLILAEIPDPTVTIEKRVKSQDPETKTKKTKTLELDADGNPVKRARKEKAPKAPKEPKAHKATLTEEEKAALKVEKEAAKAAAKEAAKAAKQLEREAAKAAKAQADAEKPAKEPKVKAPKEARLPIPWCGVAIESRCHALRSYHGLFAQCVSDKTETGEFCAACEKAGAPFGTVAMRAACGVFDYTAPNGKKCVRLANVIDKFGFTTTQAFHEEAAKHDITIPYEHLEKEVKQRGRPKSLSPRAAKGKSKVATTDTTPASSRTVSDADNSDTETETDEPVTAVAAKAPKAKAAASEKKKQARKKVEKTAAAAADAEAPKKRGRPAKAKEPTVEVNESLIQDLVSSASGRASDAAASSAELVEEDITPMPAVTVTAAAPKKVNALKKKTTRATEVVNGMTLWVESFEGNKIWVNPSDLTVYDASNGEGVGTWDDAAKTIIFEDDEEDAEIEQFSEEED